MPVRTSPTTSMKRCSPTLLLKWETTGSRRKKDARGLATGSRAVSAVMSVPHAGVDQRGDDVHDEVGDGDDDGQEHHDALDGHEVARREVVGQLEAKAFPLKS